MNNMLSYPTRLLLQPAWLARGLAAGLGLLCCAGCQTAPGGKTVGAPPPGETAHHAGESPDEHSAHEHAGESAAEHAEHEHAGESAAEHAEHEHAGDSAAMHAEEEPDEHDEAGHAHHAGEEGHAGHHHAELISLSPEQLKAYGVKVETAAGGQLEQYLTLPGEVAVNADKVGHVLPKLPGVVKQVRRNLGDTVHAGDLLAVIDSRELAEAKADYLAARERLTIAQATRDREQQLVAKGVSPEQDAITAGNAVREVQIQVRAAEQGLRALGVTAAQLDKLLASPLDSLTTYQVYAPLGGRILEKHVSLGEMVTSSDELFLIADLSSVWVNLSIGQQDLPLVREGQRVRIRFGHTPAEAGALPPDQTASGLSDVLGRISYIDALVAEDTRAASARVVLANPQGQWRPGMFVSGLVTSGSAPAKVLVPLSAIISFEGRPTIFIQDEDGFEPRTIEVGRQSALQAEVLTGLAAGDRFVSAGAYMVKAELGKSEASHEH